MRILVVTQYFWPENFQINDLVLGFKQTGHDVQIMTGIPNYPTGRFFPGYGLLKPLKEKFAGMTVLRVPLIPRGKGQGWRLALNYISFVVSGSLLGPLLCRGPYDLIFVFEPSPITVGLPALLIKKLTGVPLMFWVQDLWPESLSATGAVRSKWILELVRHVARQIYSGCDRILIQSRAFVEPIVALGIDAKRLLYFPNSAEELYRPLVLEPEAPERSQVPSGFVVMFAGNIGAAQDFGTILTAAELLRKIPSIHWIIIGDGRMWQWVQEEVRKRHLHDTVHLLGRYPQEAMPRYFALADVLLVTLRRDPIFAFTIPSKLQSYLACGKPVIAALDGEGARIIEEAQAGFSAPAEAPAELAAAVSAMYHLTESGRLAMGKRARNYFERHFERSLLLTHLDGWMRELKQDSADA